jgi:hypothetical protein
LQFEPVRVEALCELDRTLTERRGKCLVLGNQS